MSTENIRLSLVLPAYNEARRLPPYLESVLPYLAERYGDACEVIVVDDGSTDELGPALEGCGGRRPQVCLRREPHRGKGAAVRIGMLAARGELLLYADADGATPIQEEARLSAAIAAGADVAVGSRLAAGADVRRRRAASRGLAGRAFAAWARWRLRLTVGDPQCGFKMFRREVGQRLFALVQEPGYLFDLEVLALADQLGYRVAEVPIHWHEIPGGHFRPLGDLGRILMGLRRLGRRLRG